MESVLDWAHVVGERIKKIPNPGRTPKLRQSVGVSVQDEYLAPAGGWRFNPDGKCAPIERYRAYHDTPVPRQREFRPGHSKTKLGDNEPVLPMETRRDQVKLAD